MAISRKEREEIMERNSRRGWSFSQQELEDLYNRHYNGSEHDKELIEEELTDANWHSAVRHLEKDDYEGLAKEHNAEYGSSWKPETNRQIKMRQGAKERVGKALANGRHLRMSKAQFLRAAGIPYKRERKNNSNTSSKAGSVH